jgi:CubicO group peptidase (beta-lactamase class C family)
MKYKPFSIIILCISVAIGILLSCAKILKSDDGWKTCGPGDVGMDAQVTGDLIRKMHSGELGRLDGLVIVKDGMLVVDEYENQYNADRIHTIQSDTKSITSLLIGIAVDQGNIANVDAKILGYFQGYGVENLDDRKREISIDDLLTMRGGFDWDEFATSINNLNPVMKMNNSPDWLRTSIDAPMRYEPGTVFQYNSGGVMILDHVLFESTGMHADAYARKYLFGPLGIKDYFWARQHYVLGMPHTGGGLYMRPRDLAKIGQLVLNRGTWDGKQIVSEEWLNVSLRRHITNMNLGVVQAGYGYLWWLFPDPGHPGEDIATCMGSGGQYVFIVPRHNMVVVTSANEFEDRQAPLSMGVNILYNYALKSVGE